MAKNKIVELNVHNAIAAWDFDKDIPFFNPGRDTIVSWGNPDFDVPPDMAGGFDISKGAMRAITLENFAKLFPDEVGDDPQVWALAQKTARLAKLDAEPEKVTTYTLSDKTDDDGNAVDDEYNTVTVSNGEAAELLRSGLKRKVTHIWVSGQRRAYAAAKTLCLAKHTNPDWEAYTFATVVDSYDSVNALRDAVLLENGRNAQQDYALADKCRIAMALMQDDPSIGLASIGQKLTLGNKVGPDGAKLVDNHGNRQKVYRFAKLGILRPRLNLSARFAMPVERDSDSKPVYVKGGWVPFDKLNKEFAQVLIGARKAEGLDKVKGWDDCVAIYNERHPDEPMPTYTPAKEGGALPPSELFEIYVEWLIVGRKTGDTQTGGAISPTDMATFSNAPRYGVAYAPIAEVLKAVLSGDKDTLTKLAASWERGMDSRELVIATELGDDGTPCETVTATLPPEGWDKI